MLRKLLPKFDRETVLRALTRAARGRPELRGTGFWASLRGGTMLDCKAASAVPRNPHGSLSFRAAQDAKKPSHVATEEG